MTSDAMGGVNHSDLPDSGRIAPVLSKHEGCGGLFPGYFPARLGVEQLRFCRHY